MLTKTPTFICNEKICQECQQGSDYTAGRIHMGMIIATKQGIMDNIAAR